MDASHYPYYFYTNTQTLEMQQNTIIALMNTRSLFPTRCSLLFLFLHLILTSFTNVSSFTVIPLRNKITNNNNNPNLKITKRQESLIRLAHATSLSPQSGEEEASTILSRTKNEEEEKRKENTIYDDNTDCNNHDEKIVCSQFELWLDLRQTTISPQAALSHITNDLWDEYIAPDDKSFLIDKVLVHRLEDEYKMKQIIRDVEDEYEDEIQVLFQGDDNSIVSWKSRDDNNRMNDNDDDCENDNLIINNNGSVFQIFDDTTGQINAYVNPMPAIEIISLKKWLVLDSSGVEDKSERSEAIQSLVQLCLGSNGGIMAISATNSDKMDDTSEKSVETEDETGGGIVIDCSSNSEIFEAAALIKSISGDDKGYITTESGILLQQLDQQNNQQDILLSEREKTVGIKYAILIPFDSLLWKTASFVAGGPQLD